MASGDASFLVIAAHEYIEHLSATTEPLLQERTMRTLALCLVLFITACEDSQLTVALGTLERERIALTATASEVVTALPVSPGTQVAAGTVLVRLDDTLQKAQVDKAEAMVARAQANFDKLRHGARPEELASARARVSGARSQLTESEANLRRVVRLEAQKLASQAELDRAQSLHDTQMANLEQAEEALLLLTEGTRKEDLRAAEAALKEASAILHIENKRLADLTVTATRDGVLDNLPWNLGERVTAGSPLAVLLAGSAPFARIYVPEPKRVSLRVGDRMTLRVDGLDETIEGSVRWISIEPSFTPYYALNQEERSRLVYLAEVQLPDRFADLPSGVPVQVELP